MVHARQEFHAGLRGLDDQLPQARSGRGAAIVGVERHGHELPDAITLQCLQEPFGPRRGVSEAELHEFRAARGAEGRAQRRGLEGALTQQG